MRQDDEQLVSLAMAGEQDAFVQLAHRYRDAACAVAYSYLGNFDDVQDAVQDALVQAYRKLRQLRDPAHFGPWLRTITINMCLGMLRSRNHYAMSMNIVEEAVADPADGLENAEERILMADALSGMSETIRTTLMLFHINGYSHAEIAQFLEIPVGTVRSRLRSARKKLSKEMIAMFDDAIKEGRSGIRISNEYVLYTSDLTEATGDERLDDFLYMLTNVLRVVLDDRVRSLYLTGNYASGRASADGGLDLTVFLVGQIDTQHDDMRRVWSLVEHLTTYADLRLGTISLSTVDSYRHPSKFVESQGYLPGPACKEAVKNHSLLLWGEDIRRGVVLDDFPDQPGK